MEDYIDHFVAQASEVSGISYPKYLGYFLNGLRDEIRLELPFYSMGGISIRRTMKLRGQLKDAIVIVMVDNGTSQNFLVNSVAYKLRIPVEAVPSFGVRLGDGHRSQSSGMRYKLSLDLTNCKSKLIATYFLWAKWM
ncbi:hypothetical protein GH714_009865 [Hevea brasiliensis]|uniref:Uncharacterized protein n=1 Tax=Hevea brasiliensis TaxID=3981 RepID=A0A6A6M078_HEVBR|nr:hypothetical protein GH714_009865 [Hevea brasiliensis]